MPSLEIRLEGDPVLREVASAVDDTTFGTIKGRLALMELSKDMLKTCRLARGIGLAAPQVGVSKRLVVTLFDGPRVWVNPVLTFQTTQLITGPETCLSLPRKVVEVTRAAACSVTYQDLHGHSFSEDVRGALAIILQHEVDHLNGILITDYERKPDDQSTESDQAVPHVPSATADLASVAA